MLAVLSPAKKLNFDPMDKDLIQSQPAFHDDANALAEIARKLSVSDLQKLMKISEKLASLNKDRFAAFAPVSDEKNAKQAAFAFAGDTYTGLQISNMEADDVTYAQDHLRILSGLYGTLKPLDLMQPYRLEMSSRLQNKAGLNLYAYWGDRIGAALDDAANGVVINCASHEYFKATGKNMTARIITPAFKEERDDDLKMIGFFAKKARGMMARFMVLNRIEDPEGLKDFDLEGYKYQPKLSNENDWMFTRKST